jgi:hypothetical protein
VPAIAVPANTFKSGNPIYILDVNGNRFEGIYRGDGMPNHGIIAFEGNAVPAGFQRGNPTILYNIRGTHDIYQIALQNIQPRPVQGGLRTTRKNKIRR